MRTSARLFVSLFGLAIVAGCSSTGGGNLPGVVGDGLSGGSVPRGGDVDVQVVVSPVAAEAAGVRQTAWQAVVGAFLALTDEAGAIHRAGSSTWSGRISEWTPSPSLPRLFASGRGSR